LVIRDEHIKPLLSTAFNSVDIGGLAPLPGDGAAGVPAGALRNVKIMTPVNMSILVHAVTLRTLSRQQWLHFAARGVDKLFSPRLACHRS
jgi:hypothetical protein